MYARAAFLSLVCSLTCSSGERRSTSPHPRYSAITYLECATTVDCMGEHLRRTKRGARPGFCGRPQQLSYQSQTCHTLASPCSIAPSPYSFPSHQL